MQDSIFVVGHRNPDTDSICAAVAYAELKRRQGISAVAARAGEISRETAFVLERFGLPCPPLLETVRTQVCDLALDPVTPISPDSSIKTAWTLIKKHNIKTLPVTDEGERLIGIVTLSDMARKYMDIADTNHVDSRSTSLTNLLDTLAAELLFGDPRNFAAEGKVVVAAMTPDQMGAYVEPGDVVLAGNRGDCQVEALRLGATCLVVTGGHGAAPETLEEASQHPCHILRTPYDTFTAARLINQSVSVRHIMTSEPLATFHLDDFLDDIRDVMLQTRHRSYPVVDNAKRVHGLMARFHLISPRRKRVILVDHNEMSQAVSGVEEADILEIIDHHRVGDIQTRNPIIFRNDPVGSTSTIIYTLYGEHGLRPPRNVAGLLCAAILSDTMKFKSPTCTYQDRTAARQLAEIAGISDMEDFATAMFKAGSSLEGRTSREIFHQDFKDFLLGSYTIGVSQINTMDGANLDAVRQELLAYMEELCAAGHYDLLVLLFTDVLKEGSEILFVGERSDLAVKAFGGASSGLFLPGVVSRKKQVIPLLAAAVE